MTFYCPQHNNDTRLIQLPSLTVGLSALTSLIYKIGFPMYTETPIHPSNSPIVKILTVDKCFGYFKYLQKLITEIISGKYDESLIILQFNLFLKV